jgi:hypothetical protein
MVVGGVLNREAPARLAEATVAAIAVDPHRAATPSRVAEWKGRAMTEIAAIGMTGIATMGRATTRAIATTATTIAVTGAMSM